MEHIGRCAQELTVTEALFDQMPQDAMLTFCTERRLAMVCRFNQYSIAYHRFPERSCSNAIEPPRVPPVSHKSPGICAFPGKTASGQGYVRDTCPTVGTRISSTRDRHSTSPSFHA